MESNCKQIHKKCKETNFTALLINNDMFIIKNIIISIKKSTEYRNTLKKIRLVFEFLHCYDIL